MSALAALGLCCWAAWRLSSHWSPRPAARSERAVAAAVLLPALGIATLRVMAGLGALSPWELLSAFAALALLAHLSGLNEDARRPRPPAPLEAANALPLAMGALAVGLALVAAVGLPIWQWDSLGYHLPFVAYTLQAGSLAGVPWTLPYIGSYPHSVELWDLGARALLSDDRWLDAAQLPLCLCGAAAVAGLARRAGALAGTAAAVGALWLCLPAVLLQLPSAYVDVVSAAFFLLAVFWILAPPSLESAAMVGVALGLFLGSKPSAPGATVLLGLGFAIRAWRANRPTLPLLVVSLALALGSESYVMNLVHHANPLWPVRLDLGPLHLPGLTSLGDLLSAGAAAPHLIGSLPLRMLRSWGALRSLPAFDMRVGGFGALFLFFALPLGLLGAVRRRGMWGIGLLAALATANPAIARFTLPFPALLLALSGGELGRWGRARRELAMTCAAALAAAGLWQALPGLTDGHSLRATLGLPTEKQEALLLPAETGASWAALRGSLAPSTSVALDRSFDLTYLLWRPDLENRVERLPTNLDGQALVDWIKSRNIEILVSSSAYPGGRLAIGHPEYFEELFRCGASDPGCEVFAVKPTLRELALPPELQPAPEPELPKAGAPKAVAPSP